MTDEQKAQHEINLQQIRVQVSDDIEAYLATGHTVLNIANAANVTVLQVSAMRNLEYYEELAPLVRVGCVTNEETNRRIQSIFTKKQLKNAKA